MGGDHILMLPPTSMVTSPPSIPQVGLLPSSSEDPPQGSVTEEVGWGPRESRGGPDKGEPASTPAETAEQSWGLHHCPAQAVIYFFLPLLSFFLPKQSTAGGQSSGVTFLGLWREPYSPQSCSEPSKAAWASGILPSDWGLTPPSPAQGMAPKANRCLLRSVGYQSEH